MWSYRSELLDMPLKAVFFVHPYYSLISFLRASKIVVWPARRRKMKAHVILAIVADALENALQNHAGYPYSV